MKHDGMRCGPVLCWQQQMQQQPSYVRESGQAQRTNCTLGPSESSFRRTSHLKHEWHSIALAACTDGGRRWKTALLKHLQEQQQQQGPAHRHGHGSYAGSNNSCEWEYAARTSVRCHVSSVGGPCSALLARAVLTLRAWYCRGDSTCCTAPRYCLCSAVQAVTT